MVLVVGLYFLYGDGFGGGFFVDEGEYVVCCDCFVILVLDYGVLVYFVVFVGFVWCDLFGGEFDVDVVVW